MTHPAPVETPTAPPFRRRGALITGIGAVPWTMIADLGDANRPVGIASIVLAVVAIALAIRFGGRRVPVRTPADKWQRTFGRVGMLEIAGIAVAVGVLSVLEVPALIPAAVALVVGVHFFPLAKVFGQPQYVWTGVGMCLSVAVAVVLFAVGQKDAAMAAAGLGTAVTLWATSFHVSLRG